MHIIKKFCFLAIFASMLLVSCDNDSSSSSSSPSVPSTPTKSDYTGTWNADNQGTKITVKIGEKITVTQKDEPETELTLVENADYTISPDGTITVAGKDKNGNDTTYKISIDKNGNLLIKDDKGNEVASCGKTSNDVSDELEPIPPSTTSGLTLTFPDFSDTQSTITIDSATVTKGEKITLSLPNTYDSYQWWLDSEPISGATANSYEWDTTGLTSGVHTVMCVVKDGESGAYSVRVDIVVGELVTVN